MKHLFSKRLWSLICRDTFSLNPDLMQSLALGFSLKGESVSPTGIQYGIRDLQWGDLHLHWEPYEEYMQAAILGLQESVAAILVDFPPGATEDLHTHPGDRYILSLMGTGTFLLEEGSHKVRPGTRVWVPRDTAHTFAAGEGGLLLLSFHSPFIPFQNENVLEHVGKG